MDGLPNGKGTHTVSTEYIRICVPINYQRGEKMNKIIA